MNQHDRDEKQTKPPKPVSRKTKRWLNEVKTYSINEGKWKYAKEWCDNNSMEFKILTEEELGIRF